MSGLVARGRECCLFVLLRRRNRRLRNLNVDQSAHLDPGFELGLDLTGSLVGSPIAASGAG